jgi:hypothetical protein
MYDFSLSRTIEKVMNSKPGKRKNKRKAGGENG